ncbi:hypothetical protein EJD97_004548, partial [Solanum chilense]
LSAFLRRSDCQLHRYDVSRLSHSFNNDRNGIMKSPGPGQTNNKIHINSLPLPRWYLNKLGKTSRLKVFGLNLLAIGALLHKHRNISHHNLPLIDLLEIMIHFGGNWMNKISGAMILCNNIISHIINIGHTKCAVVSKHTIFSYGE